MKKCALILIVLFTFTFSSCAPLLIGGISCLALSEDNASNGDSEDYNNYLKEISSSLSDDSKKMLNILLEDYEIALRFDYPIRSDYNLNQNEKITLLSENKYDGAIFYIYSSIVRIFCSKDRTVDQSLIGIFQDNIDTIYLYENISCNSARCPFLINSDSRTMLISVYGYQLDATRIKLKMFGPPFLMMLYERFGFNSPYSDYSDSFESYNQNGFLDYDVNLYDEDYSYSKILDDFETYDQYFDREKEYLKAGFIQEAYTISLEADYQSYATGLISNESSFWNKYSIFYTINKKALTLIDFFHDINHNFTLEYFLSLSHPMGVGQYDTLKDLSFDLTSEYIGTWSGEYMNNSGLMNLVLQIDEVDPLTGALFGVVQFAPGNDNKDGKSGEYSIRGIVDFKTAAFDIYGVDWISEQPSGYNMLDMSGLKMFDYLFGDFIRDELTEFIVQKVE